MNKGLAVPAIQPSFRIRIFTLTALISFGLIPALLLTSCSSPAGTTASEKASFSKADTAAITELARTLHAGTIDDIDIFHFDEQSASAGRTDNAKRCIIEAPASHVRVTFVPEWVNSDVKRYYSLWMSHASWSSSDVFENDPTAITRDGWITSAEHLSSIDKTVLSLDSCTIEAVVTGNTAVDSMKSLLNLISAGLCMYDSTTYDKQILQVCDIVSIAWKTNDDDPLYISATAAGNKVYRIMFSSGMPVIKWIGQIMLITRPSTEL